MHIEIICPNCQSDTLLKREPVYTGFTKTGEVLSCIACGHLFSSESDVPFKTKKPEPALFTAADYAKPANLFKADENSQLCRYCANYVINPFIQYCSTHKKEVQATDTCRQFQKKQEERPTL